VIWPPDGVPILYAIYLTNFEKPMPQQGEVTDERGGQHLAPIRTRAQTQRGNIYGCRGEMSLPVHGVRDGRMCSLPPTVFQVAVSGMSQLAHAAKA